MEVAATIYLNFVGLPVWALRPCTCLLLFRKLFQFFLSFSSSSLFRGVVIIQNRLEFCNYRQCAQNVSKTKMQNTAYMCFFNRKPSNFLKYP